MKKKYLERLSQVIIPCTVFCFALVYIWLTRKVIIDVSASTSTFLTQEKGIFDAIFGSPEIIRMFKLTIFYSVPIFVFMVFLYLLFSKIHRVTISLGNYKIDMEQDITDKTSQVLTQFREDMTNKVAHTVGQVEDEYKKVVDQHGYQLDKLGEFGKELAEDGLDFKTAFRHFLNYLKELFCYKPCNIRYAFYFIIDGQAFGYDLLGMSPIDTLKVRELLADLITLKRPGFISDLEEHYPEIITEFESEVIHNIIGSPVILSDGEILGVVLAYTKDDKRAFSKIDVGMLNLLCQYFSVGLARLNLKDILLGMYNLEGFPLTTPEDLKM